MKKQALTLAIAAALSAPSALAAQDTSGMHYTSAAEGFYASIRVGISSSGYAQDFESSENNSADIGGVYSRFGVRGTNDLGGGMEGFYRYEARIDHQQNDGVKTRLANVGLRGAFGEVVVGTFWNNLYNFGYSATDVANNFSGNFLSSSNSGAADGARQLPNRINNAIQYTTPDLNGFKGSLLAVADNATTAGSTKDKNSIDAWGLASKYDTHGFSIGATYLNNADAYNGEAFGEDNRAAVQTVVQTAARTFTTGGTFSNTTTATLVEEPEDMTTWTVKLGYGQDNWYINGWYGQTDTDETGFSYAIDGNGVANAGDMTNVKVEADETTYMSLAAGVTLDKVALYAVWEQRERPDVNKLTAPTDTSRVIKLGSSDTTRTTLGAQYNLGAQSRVFLEYWKNEDDERENEKDVVLAGLRHDF